METRDPFATRQAILDAAYALFLRQGYHATSMRQIAKEAAVTLGAIYHHFVDKEAIFQTVLLEKHPYHVVLPLLRPQPGADLETFVRQAAEQFVNALRQQPALLNLMLIEVVEFEGKHMPMLFQKIVPQMLAMFEEVVRNSPQVRPIPTPLLVRSFIGLFFSYYVSERLLVRAMEASMLQDSLDAFIQIYLHGILKEA